MIHKVPVVISGSKVGKSIAAAAACYFFASSFLADDNKDDYQQYWKSFGSFCFGTATATATTTIESTVYGNKNVNINSKTTSKERIRIAGNNNAENLLKNSFFSNFSRSLFSSPFPFPVAVSSFPIFSTDSYSLYKHKHKYKHGPFCSTASGGPSRNNNDNNNYNRFFFSTGFTTSTVTQCSSSSSSSTSGADADAGIGIGTGTCTQQLRTYTTEADAYFQTHGKIPRPKSMHVSIEQLIEGDRRGGGIGTTTTNFDDEHNNDINNNSSNNKQDHCGPQHPQEYRQEESQQSTSISAHTIDNDNDDNILIIGDVHGCLNELQTLVRRAVVEHNSGRPFKCIILVGDLCNKGPSSAEVINFVRRQKFWYTVRGNHDDGALCAALGDIDQGRKKKYAWIFGDPLGDLSVDDDEEDDSIKRKRKSNTLSDEDIEWMSNIPYTITIPKSFWTKSQTTSDEKQNKTKLTEDTIIVHAGLVPNTPLEQQDVKAMVTLRYVKERVVDNSMMYAYFENKKVEDNNDDGSSAPQLWAKAWSGPSLVIFGHDAKRGLQIENHAIGLDTGCTYGNRLSGIILPEKTILSVDAERVHCPITRN